jgi:hypothetical protein
MMKKTPRSACAQSSFRAVQPSRQSPAELPTAAGMPQPRRARLQRVTESPTDMSTIAPPRRGDIASQEFVLTNS